MQKFNTPGCCNFFAVLGQRAQIASIASNPTSMQSLVEAYNTPGALQEVAPEYVIQETCDIISTALAFCEEAELRESAKRIKQIKEINFAMPPITNAELLWTLDNLRTLIVSEMGEQVFICIPERFAKQMDDPEPMGKEVAATFPEASYDIREAFNCLALDRSTSVVFHAMRAAEYGIRLLAKKLRVRLTHKGKRQPIESATWDKVIVAIKNKIAHAHTLPHDVRRQKRLNYYSDMADRCSYMKDLWRNDIMHTRVSFNSDEAAGALRRVTDFMKLLTTTL